MKRRLIARGVVKHLNRFLHILLVLILIGCSGSDKNESIITETRILCGISNDSLKIRTEYQLIIKTNDTLIRYEYKSQKDSTRNFSATFRINQNELIIALSKYRKREDNQSENLKFSDYAFHFYDLPNSTVTDEMGPVLFNTKYGILAIGNPLGPAAAFIDDDPSSAQVERIFEKLY